MSSKTVKIVAVVLAISLALSYVIYQAVTFSKADIETQIALKETVYETVDTKCFVLRDEEFIKSNASGTTVSFAANGERVAAGDTVSMIFASSDDADKYLKISELQKDIEHYEKLSSQANIRTLDLSSLEAKINTELVQYLNSVDSGDYTSAHESAEDFRSSVTSKQIETGTQLDYSEKLASLKNELAALKSQNLSYSSVNSEKAGYFISGTDGYENTLSYDSIESITSDDIKKAVSSSSDKTAEGGVIGRIVSNFKWYILCVVDTEKTVNLKKGEILYVNFPYSGIEKLPVTLKSIGDRDGAETELVLMCDLMNDRLTDLRIEDIEIITSEYSGYKIKNSAIRTVDGEKGVYVVSGNLLSFKKVHILYAADEYSIVDNPEGESGYIKLYDKVVTKGVELYDNKLV